ncbi:hypothetical protein [Leptolyngbya sp. 7M]|uniref:hypothetical protein n=1 Tax=Leptolyngbya sp. 7M TaxID=2812896 RepID=UPI001B8CBC1B|nr:hypothetical protein [Leptolyngbya sp. 7M]QYO62286.1 hypothetical protein JVX88_19520 [Leptolyngbya sp. 7M]
MLTQAKREGIAAFAAAEYQMAVQWFEEFPYSLRNEQLQPLEISLTEWDNETLLAVPLAVPQGAA